MPRSRAPDPSAFHQQMVNQFVSATVSKRWPESSNPPPRRPRRRPGLIVHKDAPSLLSRSSDVSPAGSLPNGYYNWFSEAFVLYIRCIC